jgi:aldehyde dehydrogenase
LRRSRRKLWRGFASRCSSQPAETAAAAPQAAPRARDGVFSTVDEAVNAAFEAQKKVAAMSLEDRGRMIDIVRRICMDRREELGRMELEETKVGRLDHKILKLTNMRFVLGVEAMRSDARSDKTGLCIIERAPWGVIGMMLPVTHSVPTMAANAINILAAGNTAVFGRTPRARRWRNTRCNSSIARSSASWAWPTCSPPSLEPSIETAEQIFHHPKIALLCVTGGPVVVKAASKSGKRVIAAGPGNPPVVVDETADLDRAARVHHRGRGLRQQPALHRREGDLRGCIGRRCKFIDAMRRAGGFELDARRSSG